MSLDQICAMPIADMVTDKAHLHLWTTNAFLFDAKSVIEAWGFQYKSCLVWVKPQMGMGNYWRVSHEFLLLGVNGKLTFTNHSKKSWVQLSRQKHSQKPDAIASLIEEVSPGPYLELFARKTRPGWSSWGNETKLLDKDSTRGISIYETGEQGRTRHENIHGISKSTLDDQFLLPGSCVKVERNG
jgi:N6-adenosine-specific RNA methylase IME4